ncbi:Transposase zinc-binding domain-containing protein [Mesobacillus persicus]|uniref:Transposase zinc-binding domain-containing protein n=1 Tax=Mesobacillus persicus TaxID=930146 RepID=A0A1H8L1X0_9BACI|nr:IS91 family transposase [Mesobacillus persicus]SEN98826.1 Transposase zinc-binding domain-containing protein [Mesobacillus persicus]
MTTLQDVFQVYLQDYQQHHRLSYEQKKASKAILNCRTAALGSYSYECEGCDHTKVHYKSCRNRHCPMCQGVNKEIWVDQRKKDILNAPYFHVVFTMPEQLKMVIYQNQRLLYDLMFKAVAETLTELSHDKKFLGAQIGFLSVLHTWGQNLHYHPHIHTIVLAGGLNKLNKWRSSSKKFFIPVKILSKKYRGKFLYYLKRFYQQNQLNFYNDAIKYKDPKGFQNLLDQCYNLDWYSYTKRTFSGPEAVMEYLGRYTHRIAISNHRILSIQNNSITFKVKDYKNNSKKKQVTMKSAEFIRRFLMHVLPTGFVKIRYYGLLANRVKTPKLTHCRELTKSPYYQPIYEGLNYTEVLSAILGKDITLCPSCKKAHLHKVLPGDSS